MFYIYVLRVVCIAHEFSLWSCVLYVPLASLCYNTEYTIHMHWNIHKQTTHVPHFGREISLFFSVLVFSWFITNLSELFRFIYFFFFVGFIYVFLFSPISKFNFQFLSWFGECVDRKSVLILFSIEGYFSFSFIPLICSWADNYLGNQKS